MKFIFIASLSEEERRTLKENIGGDYQILEGELDNSGLQLLKTLVPGIVLVGDNPSRTAWLEEAHKKNSALTFLEICRGKNKSASIFYDCLQYPFVAGQVKKVLDRAWERSALLMKVQAFKMQGVAEDDYIPQRSSYSFSSSRSKERVLWGFSSALGNNFNRERLLNLFLNTVEELIPVKILSLILPGEEGEEYKIYFQRGLNPLLCSQLSFNPSHGLLAFVAEKGRIIRLENNSIPLPRWENFVEVYQEMRLLQGVVFIPLMTKGKLTGLLSLGPKITGSSYFEEELEMLYSLAGNVALALRDIEAHHKLCYQKNSVEKILQHMTSGLIAINSNNIIETFNKRAGEILGLKQGDVIDKDLRVLPGPLGDLLFEAISTGNSFYKKEITLEWNNLPLDVSTYPLFQEGIDRPVGSVMIFDDIYERKQLEFQRNQAAQLEVLNKFVGQLAHEIKNPMVAIQTFCELLPEKYHDDSFRNFFSSTVTQEIKRLNELVEKLIAFATNLSYECQQVDLHDILEDSIALLQSQGKLGSHVTIEKDYCQQELVVKADKTILARAISYLIPGSFQSLEEGGVLYIKTSYQESLFSRGGVSISIWDSVTNVESKDLEKLENLFDPLYTGQANFISLGLPVSRKIIEEHGGKVKAVSGEKNNLVFCVSLPTCQGEGVL